MLTDKRYQLKFFFDYGAGGCLWGGNESTFEAFGVGPIDIVIAAKTGKIPQELLDEINRIDNWHATYLNSEYPSDPSLWRQDECERFNAAVDLLFENIVLALGEEFEVEDQQERYKEDPDLERYLSDPRTFRR